MSEAAVEVADPVETGASSETEPESTPTPSNWEMLRSQLPEELRNNPVFDGYQERGFAGLAQDFAGQMHLLGKSKVPVPDEKSSAEDWDLFYKAGGRPDTPGEYTLKDADGNPFTPPEGLPWDPKVQQGMIEDLHAIGLSDRQMSAAIRAISERQKAAYDESVAGVVQAAEQAEESLRRDWGANFDANFERGKRVLLSVGYPETAKELLEVELPGGVKLGDHAAFIEGLYEIGKRVAEDSFVDGGGRPKTDASLSPEAAQEEIDKIYFDPELSKLIASGSKSPERLALMRRLDQLHRVVNPER